MTMRRYTCVCQQRSEEGRLGHGHGAHRPNTAALAVKRHVNRPQATAAAGGQLPRLSGCHHSCSDGPPRQLRPLTTGHRRGHQPQPLSRTTAAAWLWLRPGNWPPATAAAMGNPDSRGNWLPATGAATIHNITR